MSAHQDAFAVGRWASNLDDLDREIARLALLCGVPILDPGVIARVLQRDTSVCGNDNAAAFGKLHDLLMVHLAVRGKAVDALGPVHTAAIEANVIERLSRSFPAALGQWRPD
jgi:hypothetical protein